MSKSIERKRYIMLRLMTHNVWNRDDNAPAWEAKGENCAASVRVGSLIRMWKELSPDIIGCQEVSRLMAELLKENLEKEGINYALIWGRFTPILYRPEKFELVDTEFLTYPEEIEGYEGEFNDVKSKAVNVAVFREKASGKVFIFATTHLWWKTDPKNVVEYGFPEPYTLMAGSDAAREYQIKLADELIEKYRRIHNCPVIFVGDMNTAYNTAAIQYALSNGYRHAHDIATDYREESVGYHN